MRNVQRPANRCAEALLQECRLLRRRAGQRIRSCVQIGSIGRVVQRAVGLVEVEAAAAATHPATPELTETSASSGSATRPEATALAPRSARSALLVAIVLGARPHLVVVHVEDVSGRRRTGDRDRFGGHRRRNAGNGHACWSHGIVVFPVAVVRAGFRRHHGELLESAVAGSAAARVRAAGCVLRPRKQRDLQVELRVRLGCADRRVLRGHRETGHLNADDILAICGQRELVAAVGLRPADDFLATCGIGRADRRPRHRRVAGLDLAFESAGRCGFRGFNLRWHLAWLGRHFGIRGSSLGCGDRIVGRLHRRRHRVLRHEVETNQKRKQDPDEPQLISKSRRCAPTTLRRKLPCGDTQHQPPAKTPWKVPSGDSSCQCVNYGDGYLRGPMRLAGNPVCTFSLNPASVIDIRPIAGEGSAKIVVHWT